MCGGISFTLALRTCAPASVAVIGADILDHRGLPNGAGLMDGTAGIHLVRLTDPVNTAITASWDRCLLLTG
ncbi:hypothetical protein OG426_16930 [Streptomyces canus]|uniref:hypothetical protein n=1 Tax=Streptomyces canus TaxID=58343 RepID=UPI00386782F9|nr:hypothetical protein OG426_16930 [Streptomyces canus]